MLKGEFIWVKEKLLIAPLHYVSFFMQLLFGCFAERYHISKFRKKNDRSLRATYHSDERREILLESITFVNHFNTSKAYLVILNLFELIYLVTGSFKPRKSTFFTFYLCFNLLGYYVSPLCSILDMEQTS